MVKKIPYAYFRCVIPPICQIFSEGGQQAKKKANSRSRPDCLKVEHLQYMYITALLLFILVVIAGFSQIM
jgi:hypothetical protein